MCGGGQCAVVVAEAVVNVCDNISGGGQCAAVVNVCDNVSGGGRGGRGRGSGGQYIVVTSRHVTSAAAG